MPNPDRAQRLGARSRSSVVTPTLELIPGGAVAPPPPDHLQELGRRVWHDVFAGLGAPVIDEKLDWLAVLRLAEAAEDRSDARAQLVTLGPLLEEPIVSPSGAVVGTRVVANPAAEIIRKSDRQIDALSTALGLSPQARARLGLTIGQAQLAAADAAVHIARMRRTEDSS